MIGGTSESKNAAVERLYDGRGRAFATGLRMLAKGYLGQIQILLGLRSTGDYRNLGDARIRPLARAAMVLRAIVLAPVLIPFGAGVQAYRALTRSTLSARRGRADPIAN